MKAAPHSPLYLEYIAAAWHAVDQGLGLSEKAGFRESALLKTSRQSPPPITSAMAKPPQRKKRSLNSKNNIPTPPATPPPPSQPVAKRSKPKSGGTPLRRSLRIRALVPDTSCHIKRLPVELLLMVFLAVGRIEHGVRERMCPYVQTVLKLAHVCRHWREIVVNIPPVVCFLFLN